MSPKVVSAKQRKCIENWFISFANSKEKLNQRNELKQRCVFISLLGLYNIWSEISIIELQYSILILPLKRKWLYKKSKNNILYDHNIYNDIEFITFLKYKDIQNLIIFMYDDDITRKSTKNKSIGMTGYYYDGIFRRNLYNNYKVSNVYQKLSNKLSILHDPISNKKYNPLNLSKQHWELKTSILDELMYANCEHKCIRKIINDSGNNLRVIGYNYNTPKPSQFVAVNDTNNNSIWVISVDYFK